MKNGVIMRFLTLRVDKNINEQHLYKDVGGIPFALSKYCGYKSSFAYFNTVGKIENKYYEKYVNLISIDYGNFKILNWLRLIKFVYFNAAAYNILNMYHGDTVLLLLAYVAKLKNPSIKIYIKLDLGRKYYNKLIELDKKKNLKYKIISEINKVVDLYTVETKEYVDKLNKIKKFHSKVKYLPNGFFSDLVSIDEKIPKEKIILTVGRLGTYQKNTELLIHAIANIEPLKLYGWKVYLVGSITDKFINVLNSILLEKTYLKNVFVITGNINDKKELYKIYARSSVFVLPSRWESWGLVVTEAINFECYTILTNCCDAFKEMFNQNIKGNEYGKIIESENTIEFQKALEDVLDNKINYEEKGRSASKFVRENFDWKIIVKNLDFYFKELEKVKND